MDFFARASEYIVAPEPSEQAAVEVAAEGYTDSQPEDLPVRELPESIWSSLETVEPPVREEAPVGFVEMDTESTGRFGGIAETEWLTVSPSGDSESISQVDVSVSYDSFMQGQRGYE